MISDLNVKIFTFLTIYKCGACSLQLVVVKAYGDGTSRIPITT
jgi:hypothetical protein